MYGLLNISDGKALSKVASSLNMQESIRVQLSGRKNEMKVQNDRLQTEINGTWWFMYNGQRYDMIVQHLWCTSLAWSVFSWLILCTVGETVFEGGMLATNYRPAL